MGVPKPLRRARKRDAKEGARLSASFRVWITVSLSCSQSSEASSSSRWMSSPSSESSASAVGDAPGKLMLGEETTAGADALWMDETDMK